MRMLSASYSKVLRRMLTIVGCAWLGASMALAQTPTSKPLSFKRDVRPILSNHCFACHGPDEKHREAEMRLDLASDLNTDTVRERITSNDPDLVMPPPKLNKPLKPAQIKTLERWLDQGAPYEQHWAFIAPRASQVPQVKADEATTSRGWDEQEIDRFVLASLLEEGLRPSQRADKRTLIRRVTLDLTGLPPTPAEIANYLADDSETAYERLVERLLREPAYGEHMARYWLDLVRFADTNGLHHDHYREVTPYRDWVIRAFNDNFPFDQFITYQVAGDLFDQPTQDQLIASGFNRLHLIIDVGTALPEESFFRNVVDQVSAVGTAFMGLTLQCAVCHDHKYDPITQKDFYQLFAFYNNFDGEPETGRRGTEDFKRGLQPPYLSMPSPEQEAALARFDSELTELENALVGLVKKRDAAKSDLEKLADGSQLASATEKSSAAMAVAKINETLAEQTLASLEQAVKSLTEKRDASQQAREKLLLEIPATLVMKERAEVRPAHIMIRGEYDRPGELVQRQTPAFLPPLPVQQEPATRMDLAQWLTDPSHPLTARVAVNRFWQQLFGVGMVKTSEDFGAQGEAPSHPELLDYLTVRFIDSGWDVKELMRTMVLSQTYQQTSQASRQQYTEDPRNRHLARGSRYRLDAEEVRDQLLSVCGLLNRELYGKSVKPPQPAGLWETVAMPSSYPNTYQSDAGEQIYRRSLYTFWKRAIPPPQMSIFDAPTRESCIARRERTNTPLQALLLMNEEQHFAAARHFAQSLLAKHDLTDQQRMAVAYETITARQLEPHTWTELQLGLDEFTQLYQHDRSAVDAMLVSGRSTEEISDGNAEESQGSSPQNPVRLAAWTMLIHSMLNLDQTKTRE